MSNFNLSLYHDAGFSTAQMRALESLLEREPLHWISLNSELGIYEMILDNQMFSTYRQCPAHFVEAYIKGIVPKGEAQRSWYLEFGILFHKMIESYYIQFRKSSFNLNQWAVNDALSAWRAANMDYFKDHKEAISIGHEAGFVGLLVAYAMRFAPENERLRVIGTEIGFGKAKEVKLGSLLTATFINDKNKVLFNPIVYLDCYLSGRIDVLVDDGSSIAPMDHKTMGSFRFDPAQKFEMDEGPTGYVYAVNQVLPEFLKSINADESMLRRSCNKIIMNFISKSVPKEGDRFKRCNLMKTSYQLEQYRLRMLETSKHIFIDLINFAEGKLVYRDTSKCLNWYMHDCTYLGLHRQNSASSEVMFAQSFFEKKPIWNTELVGKEE